MRQAKTLKSRIQFKIDQTNNWENFSPEKGELCIFSDYAPTGQKNSQQEDIFIPAIKIGTGDDKNISQLPFFRSPSISISEIDRIFNSYESKLDGFVLDFSTLG
jgi:hypothetical protein